MDKVNVFVNVHLLSFRYHHTIMSNVIYNLRESLAMVAEEVCNNYTVIFVVTDIRNMQFKISI